MITIKKILRLTLVSLIPILAYEAGVVGYYLFLLGVVPISEIHHIAWSLDLTVLFPMMCGLIFGYQVWVLFLRVEVPHIDPNRYRRPTHEKYTGPSSNDY